jgi:hypothetical protein
MQIELSNDRTEMCNGMTEKAVRWSIQTQTRRGCGDFLKFTASYKAFILGYLFYVTQRTSGVSLWKAKGVISRK